MTETSDCKFWVVGGTYEDTAFRRIAGSGDEERLGPFATYDDAKAAWAARAWESVDDAHARFRIEEETAEAYWVVGGVYRDMEYLHMADGGSEERYGPFATYDEAQRTWRAKSLEAEDDPCARYRIDKL